jgi:signal transduction histidine kinase
MLLLELEGNTEALELVGRTQRALNHLHHLYEEVRDYAAPINLDPQMCQIMHVWRDAWSHLEVVRKEKQVELREDTSGVELSCSVDWFAMGQVFRNVFENAISASREPGNIAITCRPSRFEGRAAIEISIRDNGPGLDPGVRDKVFDAFFTTKTKGTGLGMAIARRIVEAHGGRIAVGSTNGGAEFVITLPRTQ